MKVEQNCRSLNEIEVLGSQRIMQLGSGLHGTDLRKFLCKSILRALTAAESTICWSHLPQDEASVRREPRRALATLGKRRAADNSVGPGEWPGCHSLRMDKFHRSFLSSNVSSSIQCSVVQWSPNLDADQDLLRTFCDLIEILESRPWNSAAVETRD